MLPDMEVYELLREAFRGGNTHANRYYAGKVLRNVYSADRSSSYPDCQVNDIFPMGRWYKEMDLSMRRFVDQLGAKKNALLARIKLYNVELRYKDWGCPYLARAKCYNVIEGEFDNGRILRADFLECVVTDIDFRIILEEYNWDDIEIEKCFYARYGKLPKALTDLTIKYYRDKTELKGGDNEIYYMKQKNKLNC